MFNPEVLRKKKLEAEANTKAVQFDKKKAHSVMEEMSPKEKYETSEEKEIYSKGRKPSSFTGTISNYKPTDFKGTISTTYKPTDFGKIKSDIYKPTEFKGTSKIDYKPADFKGTSKIDYKPADFKKLSSNTGIFKKGELEELSKKLHFGTGDLFKEKIVPNPVKMPSIEGLMGKKETASPVKKESAAKLDALIKSAAKKPVKKEKGEIIMFKEGNPASKKDEDLVKKNYLKAVSKKAK